MEFQKIKIPLLSLVLITSILASNLRETNLNQDEYLISPDPPHILPITSDIPSLSLINMTEYDFLNNSFLLSEVASKLNPTLCLDDPPNR